METLTQQDLRALRELAEQAARVGGATLLAWRDRFTAREKGPADLVTDADFAAQQAVRDVLLTARPDDAFVGEESTDDGSPKDPPADRVCWVVDPLDGTTNYVHGFPAFATSIGAVLDGRVVAGAIYDPLRDEMFSCARGEGATLNGDPLAVSNAETLGESLVAVSLPAHVSRDSPDLAGFVEVVQTCRAVRRTGSSALNLAYVAAGRLDAHWARVICPWDAAAGTLLAEEAGAVVTASDGEPFDVWRADYLAAATPSLHDAVLGLLGR